MANQKFRTAAELLEYQKKRFDQLQKTQGSDIQDGYDVLRSQGLNIPSYNDRMEYNANRAYRSDERSLYEYQPPKKSIAPTQTMSTAYVEKTPAAQITAPTIQPTQPTIQSNPQGESLPWYKRLLNWMNQGADPEMQKAMQQVINTPTDQYFKSDAYKQAVKDTGPISAGFYKGSLAPFEALRGIGNVATGMFKDKQLSDLIVGQQDTFKEPAQWKAFKQARAEEMAKKGFVGNIPETLSETMTAMLPAIATGGVGGLTELGIQAGGQNAQQALDEGATPLEAGAYGAVTGTAEALYERMFGFIPGLKGLEGKALGNLLTRNASQNLRRSAFDFGKKMLGEGLEEVIMEPTQQISKGLLYDNSVSFNPLNKETYGDNGILPLRRMAESGALGVMAGSILGSVQLPSQISQSREMVADLQKNITDDLYVASNMPKNSMSYKMMDSLTQKGIDNVTFNEYSTLANTLRSEVQRMNNFEQQNQGAINRQPTILQSNAGTPQRKFYERGASSQFTPRVNQTTEQIQPMPQVELNNEPTNQSRGENILPNQNEGVKNDSARSNNSDPFDSVFGIDSPTENTPTITENNTEIDNRTFESVGDRKVKAIQHTRPELKPHIQGEAKRLLNELKESQKGRRIPIIDENGDIVGYKGENRVTSPAIERILENLPTQKAPTYDEIQAALEKIIRDGGAENNALSKRIELIIDDNLSQGTTDMTGMELPSNQEYVNLKNQSPDGGNMVEEQTQQTTETKPTTETTNKPSYQVGDTVISPSNKKYTIIGNEGKDYRIRSSDGKTTFPIRKEKLESGYKKEGTSQQESTNNQETVKEEPKPQETKQEEPNKIEKDNKVTLEENKDSEIQKTLDDLKNVFPDKQEESQKQPDKIDVLVDKMTELVDTIKSNNATAPEEVKAPEQKPHEKIAYKVLNYIRDGKKLTNDTLYSFADEAYGGTQTQGTYSVKDAHDAMELAVNKYILELPARKGDYPADEAVYGIKTFEGILNNLPTQGNNRSTEMQSFQQFSTPPSIAFVSSWLANINETDTMLEPSAGIGGLAVFAKRVGAKVYVNELSKRRLEVLRSLPFDRFFNENAEQLNNILPKDVKASVVIMNPPFSSTAGRTSKNSSLNAGVHIEQALKRLVPDGRLVAIVGHPMSDTSSQFSNFWKDIKSKYNVRANFSIDGKNYRKYGTTYDIRIVIIDNNGPTKTPVFTGHFEDINQVPKALEAIRNDRPSIEVKQDATVTRSNETSEQSGSQPTVSTPSTTRGEQGTRVSDKTPRTEVQQDSTRPTSDDGNTGDIQQPDTVVTTGRDNEGTQTNKVEETKTTETTGVRSEQSERNNNDVVSESELEHIGEIVKSEEEMKSEREHKEENSDDVFSYYAPQKLKIKNTKTHPALLVESAAMGAVEPPDITYVPNLPQEIISNGHVSNAQLEFVSYAGQAHEQIMPNGYRRGIFNGDGTGVGKGTQIAALILDNFRRGRKKAVWISEKKGLVNDAIRDWAWVGQDPKQITSIESIGAKEDIPIKEGILFTTYSTSIMGTSVNNGVIQELDPASRLNQLVRWLGKDFDGVIVFDEAHNMSNALGDDASKTATVGIKLQELLPKARIAYFSATGATEVHNLAYATRLGLWGEGAPFKDVGDFVSKVSEGGLATMELVAKDLKSMGLYVARSISYKEVSYETLEHKITPVQHEIYNSLAKAWQMVITQTENAMEKTYQGKDSRKRAFILAQLFSNQQRFFNQILTSMSAPTLIKDIRAKLNNDKSVVLQLVNTEEAAQNRAVGNAIANEVSLDDIEISPKEMLLNYLNNIFPVSQMEEYEEEATDKFGNTKMVKKYRPVKDSEGNPVVNTEMVELRDSLIEDIKDLKTPDSIIDTILNTFGTDAVAEVTGRKKRLVKDPKTGKMKNETRAKNYKESDAEAFQRGDKRILIFSDAGGTGRSYHASVTAANQQQRVHYLVQPGWSAPKAMQGFGRTHRSAQVNAPMYNLVTTNIKGQKRFISTIAKRLDQMGALTRGERKASGGMFNAKDNLEGTIAKDTLMRFYKHLFNFATPDINGRDVLRRMNLLGKFTDKDGFWKDNPTVGYDTGTFMNRILQLEIDEQNYIFDEYMNRVEQATEAAERGGFLDLGLENYNADKIEILDDKVIRTDPITQAKTRYIQLKAYNKTQPIPYKNLETFDKGYMGIYRNTKTEEVRAVYKGNSITLENGNVEQSYKLYSVVLDRSQYTEKTLESRMEKVSENEGKQLWEDAYKSAPEYHEKYLHLFTGTLLPIWNKLPKGNVKVYRVKDSKGNEYLGRFIPPAEIDSTLRAFNADRTKQSYDAEKAYDDVVNKGKAISLENDNIVIKRSRVSGEYRIEIMGDNLRFLTRAYPQIIQERIQWKERYFIPVSEKGKDIFSKIIESNPIASIESNSDKFDSEGLTSSAGGPSIGRATGANTTGKSKRASEIFADFSKKLGVSVRQAKVGRNRLGEFDNNTHLVKIKHFNDIPALSHETGHYLDRLYDLSTNRSHRTELEDLGKATSLPSYSKARIRREGVAEFVRLYLTDNNVARQTAPGFYTAFEQEIPEEVLDTLQELRKEIWSLVNLDPVSRVERSISFHDDTNYMDKLKQIKDFDIFSAARKTYTGVIDATYPLEWAARKAGEKDYIQQKLAQMRGYEGIALFDINPNLHKNMYQTNLSGQKVGTSYGEITKEIHRNNDVRRKFMDYQVARRALDYYDKGLKMPDTLETYEENIRILELQYPEFKGIFKDLQTYRHNLSKLMVEGGIYSKEQLQDMIDANPNYVPLQRIMEGFDMVAGSGTLLGGAKKLMKRLQGSGRDIVDPEESDINNTFLYRAAAMRNKVLQDLTGMFDHKVNDNAVDGMGWLISRAPHKSQPVTFNLEQVKKQLEEAGVDTTGLDLDTMVRIFVPNYLARENQIVVYRDGKPVIYDVHPELYRAVQGMRFEQLEWITKPFAALASIQRAGIIFTDKYLLYNLSRDTFHGLVSSRANITPVDIVGGMVSALFRTQTYKDAMRTGATTNYFSANDRNYAKDTIKDIYDGYSMARKFTSKLPPWKWLRIIRDLTEPIEMASRVAEYKKILKQTGNSAEAVYGARDLSIDFRRMGSWVKALQLNRVSLFLNSSLQGLDKTGRMFRYNPIKTTIKGFLYITLPTLFLYWLNDDNEEYHNLPNWRRDFFWNFPIGDPKTTNIFLPIPKPFELGVIFGALPERLLRKYKEEDPKAWKDFGETIKRTFVPELKVSAIQPEMDIMANRDWRNRPIISQSDERVSAKLQYNSYTSEIAKELGDFFDASPKKIEHLITGHFGTWGKTALDLSDAVLTPDKGSSDVSAFGKKFIVDSRQSPQSIEDFYDNYNEVQTAYNDAKRVSGKPNALEKALNKEFSNVAEDLSKYRTWQTAVDIANVKNEKLINAAIQQMAIQKTKDVNKLYDKLKEIISNKK